MSATPDSTAAAPASTEPGKSGSRRNRKIGKVISDKMEKTVIVEVTRLVKNTRYGRYQKRSATFFADDRAVECRSATPSRSRRRARCPRRSAGA